MANYDKGAALVADGVWAYLQPDGSWGYSNAGLVAGGSESLLVDTLFDLRLTQEMLDALRAATPVAERIETVVNTHANGDHCYGNELVAGAEIIASEACAEEMAEVPPELLAGFVDAAPTLGEMGEWVTHAFADFEFHGITLTPPTRTFTGELAVTVGTRVVRLVEVGPAHTRGDVIVHVPDARVLFTGDILFHGGHPVVWAGPVANWIAACERILAMDDVDVIVPGHGPVTDTTAVAAMKRYLEHVSAEARVRFDQGMEPLEAARHIPMGDYDGWSDGERLAVTVTTLYRDFGGDPPADIMTMASGMASLLRRSH